MSVVTSDRARVLVLGGSRLQVALIRRARELGHTVGVVDMDPNAAGRRIADKFYEVSTNDVESVLMVADEFGATAVCTMATDMPMRTVAEVALRRGLFGPTLESVYRATDKSLMAEALRNEAVPVPASTQLDHADFLNGDIPSITVAEFPVIVKPADSSGSRGVSLVTSPDLLAGSIESAFAHGSGDSVLIQEFVDGPEVSVEMLCFDGSAHMVAITDKTTTEAPHFVELAHRQPTALPEETQTEIERVAIHACEALGLDLCGAHVEIRVGKNGPRVIEVGARLGGDLITSHLTPLATGVDMVEGLLDISLGRKPNVERSWNRPAAIVFLGLESAAALRSGTVSDGPWQERVLEVELYDTGSLLLESSTDRSGHMILRAEDQTELTSLMTDLARSVPGMDWISKNGNPLPLTDGCENGQ